MDSILSHIKVHLTLKAFQFKVHLELFHTASQLLIGKATAPTCLGIMLCSQLKIPFGAGGPCSSLTSCPSCTLVWSSENLVKETGFVVCCPLGSTEIPHIMGYPQCQTPLKLLAEFGYGWPLIWAWSEYGDHVSCLPGLQAAPWISPVHWCQLLGQLCCPPQAQSSTKAGTIPSAVGVQKCSSTVSQCKRNQQ